MSSDPVKCIKPLGFPWETFDPFLVCVHHRDAYPAGNERMGPAASLTGRRIGQDFGGKDGWRMYHGEAVPGFPRHPHRGFETVTLIRSGFVDHTDSLGATARFGPGDVQWLSAGSGIEHAEMFPLVRRDGPNPLDLFQIWLNLPGADKLCAPHFSMLWAEAIPRLVTADEAGRTTEVTLIAGRLADLKAPPPPPGSWASRPEVDVAICTLKMAPHARWSLPPAREESRRALYFLSGRSLSVGGAPARPSCVIELHANRDTPLANGDAEAELLLLQGRPIGEPVAQYGPFVMNTPAQIHQAIADYRRTRFGAWPSPTDEPVHPRAESRFARHADGRVERPAAPSALAE